MGPASRGIFFQLIFLLIIFNGFAYSNTSIVLTDSTVEDYALNSSSVSVLEDPEDTFSIRDMINGNLNHRFITCKDRDLHNIHLNSAYWIRFSITNRSRFDKSYVFESYSPNTRLLELYVPDGSGNYAMKRSGADTPFKDKDYRIKNLLFDLPVPDQGQTLTYYIHVKSPHYTSFRYHIKSNNYFSYYAVNEYLLLGIFYGILIIMAIYNILIFLSSGSKVYIFYILYVFAGMAHTLSEDRIGLQYLWPCHPEWNSFLGYYLSPFLLILSYVIYSIEFLRMREMNKKFYRYFLIAFLVFICMYELQVFMLPEQYQIRELYIVPFLSIYLVAVYRYRKGFSAARFFILGSTLIIFAISILLLRLNHVLGSNLFTVYSVHYALVGEVVILSFALADRIRFMASERIESQQRFIHQLEATRELQEKVNKELGEKKILQEKIRGEMEEEIIQRTQELKVKNEELEKANLKLKELTEELNKVNSRLDIDNWELKKEVKKINAARIFDKIISYEEFLNTFPDETSCLRFLEELKWEDDFTCRKCGNRKHIQNYKPFIRKCSRCSYPESVTAFTLFHGLKFPLHKAFYISYLVYHHDQTHTLEQLAKMLGVSKNTCWAFRKKVMAALDEKNGKIHLAERKGWEMIIIE